MEAAEDCCGLGCGERGAGFFDDLGWGSGVTAFGEFLGGEEFGVAVGAVAGAQEVEEAFFADLDGARGGLWVSCGLSCRWVGWALGLGCGLVIGRWLVIRRGRWDGAEGLEGDLEAVDHLAGAAGVDGVLGEAVDDGGDGDEDGGAVLDFRDFHAGDLGVDEDAAVIAGGVLEVMVVAVVFAFEGGRAAALAAGSLVEVALVVAVEVFEWCRHGCTPLGIFFA